MIPNRCRCFSKCSPNVKTRSNMKPEVFDVLSSAWQPDVLLSLGAAKKSGTQNIHLVRPGGSLVFGMCLAQQDPPTWNLWNPRASKAVLEWRCRVLLFWCQNKAYPNETHVGHRETFDGFDFASNDQLAQRKLLQHVTTVIVHCGTGCHVRWSSSSLR